MTTTSLGRRVRNDQFPQELVRGLREAAERSRSSYGDSPFLSNHTTALAELADHINSVGLDDQLVRSLDLIQSFSGGSSDTWSPGEEAGQFITSVGLGPAAPTAIASLAELVSVSIEDLNASLHARIKEGSAALKRVAEHEESVRTVSKERDAAKEREEGLRRRGHRGPGPAWVHPSFSPDSSWCDVSSDYDRAQLLADTIEDVAEEQEAGLDTMGEVVPDE